MRIQCNGARATCRAVVAALLIALLAACASSPTQRPQRTYGHIPQPSLLFLSMEAVLKNAGYGIAKREPARRELQTSWKERDGDMRGSVRWQERRMYFAWFEIESLQDQYEVFLELVVEERPSAGADWVGKQVVPEQDAEYIRLLQELDAAVKKIGGVRY